MNQRNRPNDLIPARPRLRMTEVVGSRCYGATLGYSIEGSQLLNVHAQ